MDRIVDYEHPETVIIHDGKISFYIPDYGLRITTKVKGTKGSGVADADDLTELNHYHIDLLNMFLSSLENINRNWTANHILKKMEIIKHMQDARYEFKDNNWRRPISEFLRKGVLTHPQKMKHRYKLDIVLARNALTNGRFD